MTKENSRLNARLAALADEQRFQVAASRPMLQLSIRFQYAPGTWDGKTSGSENVFVTIVNSGGAVKIKAALGNTKDLGDWEGVYTIGAQFGDDRVFTIYPASRPLPSIHELGGSMIGIAVTEDWAQGLTSIEVVADGYQLLSAAGADGRVGLAADGKWIIGAGSPPAGLRWLGWKHPDPKLDDVQAFPLIIDPTPPRATP